MSQAGGPAEQTQSPRGLSLLPFNGPKSRFNEYRVKLNGKSITAIKGGGLSWGGSDVNRPTFDVWGSVMDPTSPFLITLAVRPL